MDERLIRTSKFLSLVLRHQPEMLGLAPEPGGWVRVDELLAAANRHGMHLDEALLRRVVAENDKQRFALSGDGLRIRANHGHSIPVDLGLEAVEPPELLFHGTATRFLDSIRRHGLDTRKRNYVHLSADIETALKVGRRHGEPVVLHIQAGRMTRDGLRFYHSASGVWLTEHVPPEYIVFPEEAR